MIMARLAAEKAEAGEGSRPSAALFHRCSITFGVIAERILQAQESNGGIYVETEFSYPGWMDRRSGHDLQLLNNSAEANTVSRRALSVL